MCPRLQPVCMHAASNTESAESGERELRVPASLQSQQNRYDTMLETGNANSWLTSEVQHKISVRPFHNSIQVPRVNFGSYAMYMYELEAFLTTTAIFLRSMVLSWMSVDAGATRLTWTQRDMLVNGMANFPELHFEGKHFLYHMTQQNGLVWCDYAMSRLEDCIVSAYRSYTRAKSEWKPKLDIAIFTLGLQNELVSTLYENAHIIHPLFLNNFVAIETKHVRLIAREVWEEMLLTFFCGTHSKLGSKSLVNLLNADVIEVLRAHLLLV